MSISVNADFISGAALVASLVVVKKLYDLCQAPSVKGMQELAKRPIKKIGDDAAITVWGFELSGEYPVDDLRDTSPYVERIECYLRLRKQDYVKAKSIDLSENPRCKLPFANVYGTVLDDSRRILKVLHEKLGDTSTNNLTERQRAEGRLVQDLLTGSLYWVLLHHNFGTDEGRTFLQKTLMSQIPAPLAPLILAMIFRKQSANLLGAGFGLLPHEEIVELGREDLRAIAGLLGTRTYILDTTEPTVYDSDVYAFVGHFFFGPLMAGLTWVKEIRHELVLLDRYMNRMRTLLYPDLEKKKNA